MTHVLVSLSLSALLPLSNVVAAAWRLRHDGRHDVSALVTLEECRAAAERRLNSGWASQCLVVSPGGEVEEVGAVALLVP